MKRASVALFALLVLAACTNYADRIEPYPEALPPIQLEKLKGQEVMLDLRDQNGLPIAQSWRTSARLLRQDLEQSIERAGVRVTDKSPLALEVTFHYLDSQYRTGRWESCGRLTGRLTRDGKAVTQQFTTNYCSDATPNPWENPATQRSARSEYESRDRTYFGMLRAFLMDLEENAAKL